MAPEYKVIVDDKETGIRFPLDEVVVAQNIDDARSAVEGVLVPKWEDVFSGFEVKWRGKIPDNIDIGGARVIEPRR